MRMCAWCNKHLTDMKFSEVNENQPAAITHGICDECVDKVKQEIADHEQKTLKEKRLRNR